MQSAVSLIITLRGNRLVAEPAPIEAPTHIEASETDIVELVLALHAAEILPGLTQEELIQRARRFFGVALENWQQLGANIRRRDSLTFLPRLQKGLDGRNDQIKENGRANRRPKYPKK